MRNRLAVGSLLLLGLAADGIAGGPASKGSRPHIDLRASPRVAFSPVDVLLTAEIRGEAVEDFHCPQIEWTWDDGGRSVQESDCAPLEPGAEMERRYTARHAYRRAGTYNVKVTMRRASRTIAVATATVSVRPGIGDMTATID